MDAYDVIVAELFGDAVDPREVKDVISKQGDVSEVHVNSAKAKREKREAQIGLASNIVGLAAGGAALAGAAKNPALRRAIPANPGPITGPVARLIGANGKHSAPTTNKVVQFVRTPEGRARVYQTGAAGALALQAGNTIGDVVANRVLGREAKKEIAKAFGGIIDARRRGIIDTETAIQMSAELVSKLEGSHRDILNAVDQIAAPLPSKKVQMARTGVQAGMQVADQGKKVAATGRKGIAFARKAQPQPITPDEAVPMGKAAPRITWSGEIAKMDSEKRQVFGFALVTHIDGEPVVDLQGDYTPLEEIEKAAYTYVIESRKGGDMHQRDGDKPLHTSDLVESFVITPEKLTQMGLEENALPHGWWVGFKVNDDKQWADVVAKRRTGFSIHGSGRRVEKAL